MFLPYSFSRQSILLGFAVPLTQNQNTQQLGPTWKDSIDPKARSKQCKESRHKLLGLNLLYFQSHSYINRFFCPRQSLVPARWRVIMKQIRQFSRSSNSEFRNSTEINQNPERKLLHPTGSISASGMCRVRCRVKILHQEPTPHAR
jgi:hypothetical protein